MIDTRMGFEQWIADLERRHLADLRFSEVSRALRALSSAYVERRGRLREGAALSGAGKRAAFALFYGPLHFLLVQRVVESLGAAHDMPGTMVDLGCGTGAAGVAWAAACVPAAAVTAVDRNMWALSEAAGTYRTFGVRARTRQGDLTAVAWPAPPACVLAAFAANELDEAARGVLLTRLLDRAAKGDRVLVVEPLARSVAPWWNRWRHQVEGAGGHADEWRFRVELPAIVGKLDRAAGLDHRELTARTLYLRPGRAQATK